MTDIVKRLERLATWGGKATHLDYEGAILDAKAEIETLRAGNERLREALLEIVATCQAVWDEDIPDDASECEVRVDDAIADAWRTAAGIARRALEGKDG